MSAIAELEKRIGSGELKFATVGRSILDGGRFAVSICHGKADFAGSNAATMEEAVAGALAQIKKGPPPVSTPKAVLQADVDDLDDILG